jgi:hypothetical protein
MSNAECYKCKTALFSAMLLCAHFFLSFMFCDVLCVKSTFQCYVVVFTFSSLLCFVIFYV